MARDLHGAAVSIPIGPTTAPLPPSVAATLAGRTPSPGELAVSRMWIARRDGRLVVHFGPITTAS
jgi:hypothetical protein